MPLPELNADGFLPPRPRVHQASQDEVAERFALTPLRKRLWDAFVQVAALGRQVGVPRALIDGSFVTEKRNESGDVEEPNDIDTTFLLPSYWRRLRDESDLAFLELRDLARRTALPSAQEPVQLFLAADETEYGWWADWWSRIRGTSRRKGIAEVSL